MKKEIRTVDIKSKQQDKKEYRKRDILGRFQ